MPGIRTRTTVFAVLVVGISVAAAMVALVLTARTGLTAQLANNAEARAQDIALLAKAGKLPHPIPGRGDDLLVQVLDHKGMVVASSASIDGQEALVKVAVKPGHARTFRLASVAWNGAPPTGEAAADSSAGYLVATRGVKSPHGKRIVVVAASLDSVEQFIDVLVPRLAWGLPLIMLVVGLTVWALTGRALGPVEAIRSEAEAISASSLERRVPQPQTADEIGRLAETMNRMLDRLEASSLAHRQFISDASHELKSPVASIRTMLDVARLNPPTDVTSLLDDLSAEDERLEHLVSDLLVLARFDEHDAPSPDPIEIDFDDVVLAEVSAVSRVCECAIDISGVHPVRLLAQPGSLESLVRNLVENAARHAGSTVWVASDEREGKLLFTVSDDGPGIAEQDRERVFERFVRLDHSRGRDAGGTGLGLAVCKAIAQSMGGSIRVTEPQHGGATFEVVLPLTPPSTGPLSNLSASSF